MMTMKPPDQKKHAKYSASSAHRWIACPGSISLSEKAPPQRESDYAAEGTRAHECLEALLKDVEHMGNTHAKLVQSHGIEMAEHAWSAAQTILKMKPKGAKLLVEYKSNLDFIEPDMGGTADAVIVEDYGTLTVIDYKYGQGVLVDPEKNEQLLCYALGVAHQYNYDFTDVRLVIVQPRAYSDDGKTVREWACGIDYLKNFSIALGEAVGASLNPKPSFEAGDHCRWCPAKMICPEISTKALAQAKVEFIDDVAETPPVTALTQVQISTALKAFPVIRDWMSAVESYALQSMQEGAEIPGWKLVEKRSIRKWTDSKIESRAKRIFGSKVFTEPELKSPAQFEKLGSVAKKFVENNTSSVSSGVTLAPSSDKRNAVKSTAAIDFADKC